MNLLKFFAIILTMIFSVSSVSAYSQEEVDAANLLAKDGVINDRSSSPKDYNLDATIQRQEIMKVALNMADIEVPDTCKWVFPDVDKKWWSCKYIEYAVEKWILSKNPKFRPHDTVTKSEAIKMIFESMELEKTTTDSNWQKEYMVSAYDNGIIDVKFYDYNTPATRGWIFKIAAKTVEIEKEKEEKMKEKLGKYSDEAN